MSLYFPLIGVLGLFNASSQVSSGGGVSHPKGRVMSSDQGLDFTIQGFLFGKIQIPLFTVMFSIQHLM